MDREQRHQAQKKVLTVAIGISVGVHVAALAWVKLSVPTFDDRPATRALRVLELPDAWENAAIEVIPLETMVSSAPSGALEGASATSAQVDLAEPGAAGADAAVTAIVPLSELSGAAPYTAVIQLKAAMIPPNLVAEVGFLGFDYGLSIRDISEAVVAGHQIVWEREFKLQ